MTTPNFNLLVQGSQDKMMTGLVKEPIDCTRILPSSQKRLNSSIDVT